MSGFAEFSNRLLEDRPVVARRKVPFGYRRGSKKRSRALFAVLHDAELSRVALSRGQQHYNWGSDELWEAADGTGVLLAEECFGALPGDGIDVHVHFLLPGDVHLTFPIGCDYTQSTLTITASGYSDGAVAAVLEAAADTVAQWRRA